MKVKNITIGIRSLETGLKNFAHAIRSAQQGKFPRSREERIFFVSLQAMRQVLTPKRLELLHSIREKHPDSIYELAQMTGRPLKNVQDDVSLLVRIGLISLHRTRTARPRVMPKVNYDRLQLQIPII